MNAHAATASAAAASSLILLREDIASVAVLTLNRPQTRNSLSEAMLEALGDALTAIAHDASVRAVVLPPTVRRFPPATTSRSSTVTAPTTTAAAPISSTSLRLAAP
jgi:hypothetical protein